MVDHIGIPTLSLNGSCVAKNSIVHMSAYTLNHWFVWSRIEYGVVDVVKQRFGQIYALYGEHSLLKLPSYHMINDTSWGGNHKEMSEKSLSDEQTTKCFTSFDLPYST